MQVSGSSTPIIHAQNLNLMFPINNGPVRALKDVTLIINKGEFVSFIGLSGCGKITLLRAMAALDRKSVV